MGRLTKPPIYKVGYKSGNPQRIRMITNRKSPLTRHPSVIIISSEESVMEPETDHEYYSPENQLGLPENRVWVNDSDVSSILEASGKHWFDCRQIEAEDST
jgi:hypothetical protein